MEEFLRKIGITQTGSTSQNGSYVIDFKNDDEWARAYTLLDKSDDVQELEDESNISYDTSTVQFISDEYTISLLGDMEQNKFRLVIRKS